MARRIRVLAVLAAFCLGLPSAAFPQAGPERSGREIYETICIACHGPDGRGHANAELTKVIELPDFADCSFASREPDADWIAVAHAGGPARGFSPLMRSWAGEVSLPEITAAVAHLRTFCTDDRWPRGELNLPRPLVTGKAFPEDEMVVSTSAAAEGAGRLSTRFIYERRFGPVHQFEIAVPFASAEGPSGTWAAGIGDIALGYKRTLAHSRQRGNIVSASAEVVLPTGSERRGLGSSAAVLEPFLTFGQILGVDGFVQAQAGFEIPVSEDHDSEAFWRAAIGRSFTQGPYGRQWSPMVELLGSRELASGARIDWDVLPGLQITLNKRQHVRLAGGVRMPVTRRTERSTSVIVYLLWDWFDGGFTDGW